MKIGSVCTGYGGIELAMRNMFPDAHLEWTADIDKASSTVIQHRFGVPNLGDLKKLDWASVPPVDFITGGYPCQPFSTAGSRKGSEDPRHLWPYLLHGLVVMQPEFAFFENVQGHVSLGLGTVITDLEAFGYTPTWTVIRASDIGAPHRRARVFIFARRGFFPVPNGWKPTKPGRIPNDGMICNGVVYTPSKTKVSEAPKGLPTPKASDRKGYGPGDLKRDTIPLAAIHHLLPTPTHDMYKESGICRDFGGDLTHALSCGIHNPKLLPTPNAMDAIGRRSDEALARAKTKGGVSNLKDIELIRNPVGTDFGKYTEAVSRWEDLIGRAPHPTEPSAKQNEDPRLSAKFVEWMMGLPEGWITSPDIDLSYKQQVKLAGNGVVPQQCEAAIRILFPRLEPLI